MRGIHRPTLLGLLATASLLLASGPASAALIVTPLHIGLVAGDDHVEVGDDRDFRVSPANDTAKAAWAGKAVRVAWRDVFDEAARGTISEALTLDAGAAGGFTWKVPAEVQDRNIFMALESGGEELALLHLRVGEAEPVALTLGGAGPGPVDDGAPGPGGQGEDEKAVPASGALTALLAIAGIAAVLVAVRPKD